MGQQTYCLWLSDISFPVSREQYQAYYKEQNRWVYLQKLDRKHRLTYYHALSTEEYSGEEILEDQQVSVEDMVEKKLLLEQLARCLRRLSQEEQILIEKYFFQGKTERAVGAELGRTKTAVHWQKEKVLCKLRRLLVGPAEENTAA